MDEWTECQGEAVREWNTSNSDNTIESLANESQNMRICNK